jgi:ubiquinone/menaquinone biosynthesis C-methylase UbiE
MKYTGERMIPEYNQGDFIWAEHYTRYIFASQFVKGRKVLDIACGSGYGSAYLARTAKKVFGVDISKETIGYAQKKYGSDNIEYLTGSAESIPLPDQSIDIVVSFETVEHISDYEKFLREIKRVLTPDGVLIMSTPNDTVFPEGNTFHTKEFSATEYDELIGTYFRYSQMLYQDNWVTSAVFNKELIASSSLDKSIKEIENYKITGSNSDKSLYLIAVCSDKKIDWPITNLGVIYAFTVVAQDWLREVEKKCLALEGSLAEKEEQIGKLIAEKTSLVQTLQSIYSSRSWKALTKLRDIKSLMRLKKRS